MKKKQLIFLILLLSFSLENNSQEGFSLLDKTASKERVSFKLINNLIVIPLEINGKKLSFILEKKMRFIKWK